MKENLNMWNIWSENSNSFLFTYNFASFFWVTRARVIENVCWINQNYLLLNTCVGHWKLQKNTVIMKEESTSYIQYDEVLVEIMETERIV